MPDLRITTMTREQLDLTVDWAAAEGWNPGRSDAACFHAADPEGFLLGSIDAEPVATISAVRYAAGFGFVGLYLVAPALRGRGHGLRIWSAAMDRLDGSVTGLDGVVAQQANYARSGFVLAHRNVRYVGRLVGALHPDAVTLTSADLDEVVAYDAPCFGAARPAFLAGWLTQPDARAVGVRVGDRLVGYGVVRPCRSGWKVGPLFADEADIAGVILDALVDRVGADADLYLDVPEPNRAAVALARSRGMTEVFETARMYAGGDPGLPLERVFGITTFELG